MAAITYPRDFLSNLPIAGLSFIPEPISEISPVRGGDIISADLGPTLWRGKYDSPILEASVFGAARAWYGTLLSYREFYAYDILRQYPLEYADGWGDLEVNGSPFDGNGFLGDVESNDVEVTIYNVPIGLILSPGDYLSWVYSSTRQALHRVSAGSTATGVSGSGEVTVEVHPSVRAGWTAATAVKLYRAVAKMVILPGTYTENISPPSFGQVSFEAMQTNA